jgi:single-strand DNA-binding protein
MRGINRVVVIGRLGRDPELRQAKTGTRWSSFSVATNRSRREGEQWFEETDWHDVRVFGDDAERCQRFLRKGSVVAVDGSLVYDVWTDDQNVKHRKPRVLANRVQFLADLRAQPEPEPAPAPEESSVADAEPSAEIPF